MNTTAQSQVAPATDEVRKEKRLRVAHINSDPGIRAGHNKGAGAHIASMRKAFSEAGAEVTPIDIHDECQLLSALQVLTWQEPLDLIYERYSLNSFASSEFARSRAIPFVLEVNSPLLLEEKLWRDRHASTDNRREREMFRSAKIIRVVSEPLVAYALNCGASTAQIVVQPNRVDTTLFKRELVRELRGPLRPPQSIVIGFHGRLRPWHNLPLLARALSLAASFGVPAHFVAIGRGNFEDVLSDHLDPSRYTLLPWMAQEDLAPYVASFDAVAFTYSASCPFYFSPLKLRECMAAGAVPIVPSLGDLPKLVGHGQCGLVINPDDPHALASAISNLYFNPQQREILSQAAIAEAANHTWIQLAYEILSSACAT